LSTKEHTRHADGNAPAKPRRGAAKRPAARKSTKEKEPKAAKHVAPEPEPEETEEVETEEAEAEAAPAPAPAPVTAAPAPAPVVEATPAVEAPVLSLNALKAMKVTELAKLAQEMKIDGVAGLKMQDLIFAILQHQKADIAAEGALEVLPDGFGFLRSSDFSYIPGPDDVYVSPSAIRRYNLRTGDTITGMIRAPKEGERYFALVRIDKINYDPPEATANKLLFDNLTPLYPDKPLRLEHDAGEMTTRIVDMFAPIGKGQRCLIVAPPRGQDGAAPEHRPRGGQESPGSRSHRVAHRRAPRRSHRHGAHG